MTRSALARELLVHEVLEPRRRLRQAGVGLLLRQATGRHGGVELGLLGRRGPQRIDDLLDVDAVIGRVLGQRLAALQLGQRIEVEPEGFGGLVEGDAEARAAAARTVPAATLVIHRRTGILQRLGHRVGLGLGDRAGRDEAVEDALDRVGERLRRGGCRAGRSSRGRPAGVIRLGEGDRHRPEREDAGGQYGGPCDPPASRAMHAWSFPSSRTCRPSVTARRKSCSWNRCDASALCEHGRHVSDPARRSSRRSPSTCPGAFATRRGTATPWPRWARRSSCSSARRRRRGSRVKLPDSADHALLGAGCRYRSSYGLGRHGWVTVPLGRRRRRRRDLLQGLDRGELPGRSPPRS